MFREFFPNGPELTFWAYLREKRHPIKFKRELSRIPHASAALIFFKN